MSLIFSGKLQVQDAMDSLFLLREGVQRSVLRPALKAAGKLMLDAAIARLEVSSGGYYGTPGRETRKLLESMDAVTRTYPAKNLVIVAIGPARGFAGTVTLQADRIYRQIGGTRANKAKGIAGVFGQTRRMRDPNVRSQVRKEDPAKIGHFVEGGSSVRHAYPFLKPAFENTKAAAEARFTAMVASGVESLAYRLPRRRRGK